MSSALQGIVEGSDLVESQRILAAVEPDKEKRQNVVIRETHISRVFLLGDRVYKFKKPVCFPFLDYSTLDRRRYNCEEELRLNRRLAPDTYLAVVPLTREAGGRIELDGTGEPIDYCVKMRRLPEERMLDTLIRAGEATSDQIEQVLDVLIPFFEQAPRGPAIDRFGSLQSIEHNIRGNHTVLEATEHALSPAMFHRVRCSQLQFLKLHPEIFQKRVREGRICEGHGDLRPDHICLLETPVVFDCVEFSLGFRAQDVISELAFLAMECESLERADLATRLIDRYRNRSHDDAPDSLVSFYKSYRACVRAKVDFLRARQQTYDGRVKLNQHANRYLQLASYHASEFHKPRLVVVFGATGTGKSTLARNLVHELGAELLRSDDIRQRLTGSRDPEAKVGDGNYTEAMNQRVYDELFRQAAELLGQASTVVIDATFRDRSQRERALELAHQHGSEICFVLCRCPGEVARKRIARRIEQGNDPSDARPEMHAIQNRELENLEDLTAAKLLTVETTMSPSSLFPKIFQQLKR